MYSTILTKQTLNNDFFLSVGSHNVRKGVNGL